MNALLIEAHPLLRLGLHQMLERIEGIDHVIAIDPADVSLLDGTDNDTDLMVFGMPQDADAGWTLLTQVRRVLNAQRVLLLSDTVPLQVPAAAMAQGVCGCLPKSASLAVLEAAIRLAMVGGYFVRGSGAGTGLATSLAPASHGGPVMTSAPPSSRASISSVQNAVVHTASPASARVGVTAAHPAASPRPAPGAELHGESAYYDEAEMLQITPRQYEVLVLLARGHPIKTVSRMLNISVATVKSHACTLYQRLKVRNKGEAVYTALQRGAKLEWVSGDGTSPVAPVSRMSRAANERSERADLPLQLGGGMR
ncbi:response regulator transcription factor [Cupriavidus sp. AU9028]|uniref:response regulator transcription factor n=1 Tax=Cupriavidus sp. AU9028 TaxID=2871157 RepID=UPI001C96D432|nr:response regulator transcription factor [Cupriavidus sp. AU9028]MBY4896854.1 response regulator transcription factor [Cupriavidus sp. AU9028]